jgi:hypothetical protein
MRREIEAALDSKRNVVPLMLKAGQTGRIADRLKREFGEDSLFMDVDSIPLGVDFPKRLNDEVARCDVLIAPIGNRWIDLTDEKRRTPDR